ERSEFLTVELECHRHCRSWWLTVNLATSFCISADFVDLRILEYRGVILRCLLALSIKPQTRHNPILELHVISPDRVAAFRFKNRAPMAQPLAKMLTSDHSQ